LIVRPCISTVAADGGSFEGNRTKRNWDVDPQAVAFIGQFDPELKVTILLAFLL